MLGSLRTEHANGVRSPCSATNSRDPRRIQGKLKKLGMPVSAPPQGLRHLANLSAGSP